MIVKVCGMRDADNIRDVEALGADWLGFIFYEKSPRYVGLRPDYLPVRAKRVGVFVDAPLDTVLQKATEYALDFIQLHGNESPEYISFLEGHKVIKALNVATSDDILKTEAYEGLVDFFLFDTKSHLAGGSGRKFDWDVLNEYRGNTPFLLSGGIDSDDADAVKAFCHPQFMGVDLNSRFEVSPGFKDITKLSSFIKHIK